MKLPVTLIALMAILSLMTSGTAIYSYLVGKAIADPSLRHFLLIVASLSLGVFGYSLFLYRKQ